MIALRSNPLSAWLERQFGYVFSQPALGASALTHRSAGGDNNERLEFLGDAVLNCCVASLLMEAYPLADEGSLSRLRAALVNGDTLAEIAAELDLGAHLRLGAGEAQSGGFRRASILADALEALIGAIFLDSGFEAAAACVARLFAQRIAALPSAEGLKDPKTRLQELLQGRGMALPEYTLNAMEGEPHERSYTADCAIAALGLTVSARAPSRRRAEQLAAAQMLQMLPAELRKSL